MGYPPAGAVDTYKAAREAVEGNDIVKIPLVSSMGAESMTKTCYRHESYRDWVYLVSTNKRIIEAEVEQLVKLGRKIQTPYIGTGTAGELIFECQQRGQPAHGFLEMKFGAGYKEAKVKDDQNGDWIYKHVLSSLKSKAELQQLLTFLNDADAYLQGTSEDIPDFQVAWDPSVGMMFLFDPGDPLNWGSALSSHQKTITRWIREATDTRLARLIAKREAGGEAVSSPSSPSSSSAAPPSASTTKPTVTPKSPAHVSPKVDPVKSSTKEPASVAVAERSEEGYMCDLCHVVFSGAVKLRTHRIQKHQPK